MTLICLITLWLLKPSPTAASLPLTRWHGHFKHRRHKAHSPAQQGNIQHQVNQEMFAKPGAPQQDKMLTIQVKNTMLHLNGQNLRLEAKNGRNSKTPGLHLSAAHGKEAVGQLTGCLLTQEGTAQLDLFQLKSPRPELEREGENQPQRRPLKLAPLQLTEEVKEAQRQKLKFIQQEVKPGSCKLDGTVNEPCTRKVKSCVRQGLVKSAECPSACIAPLKAQQQNRFPRPQLIRTNPTEQTGSRLLDDVVCHGTPAPLCSKPAPPSLSSRVRARAACGTEAVRQNPKTVQQETGTRRLRLRRAKCLEEDQCNSNMSTVGLCADKIKLAQGVQGKGQGAERALKGQLHPGRGIREPLAECGSTRKNHQEDCSQQSARCTLNRQSADGGSSEHGLEGVKLSAANWRLKRKKPLITKHNNAVPLERIQL
ncbi:uncharacterized protein LOC117828191 [Notolabrus celidotus]|uniref:uncharacterized protein LOC117828191 n=1 Tax=Notolabrus celidotus TaxID=1203425 RepID=UPI00148F872D|nr:uncharacterized protein LOC117828191 [Notolabrus celidotus]